MKKFFVFITSFIIGFAVCFFVTDACCCLKDPVYSAEPNKDGFLEEHVATRNGRLTFDFSKTTIIENDDFHEHYYSTSIKSDSFSVSLMRGHKLVDGILLKFSSMDEKEVHFFAQPDLSGMYYISEQNKKRNHPTKQSISSETELDKPKTEPRKPRTKGAPITECENASAWSYKCTGKCDF